VKANLGTAEVKARSAGRNYKASLDIFWLAPAPIFLDMNLG
jgi:hypothetical protein